MSDDTRRHTAADPPEGSYLWDRSGPPDPLVRRLEALLAPLGHGAAAARARPRRARRWALGAGLVAAAAVVMLVAVLAAPARPSGWTATPVAGRPGVGDGALHRPRALAVGEWVSTDASSSALLERGGLGRVTLDPGGRLRVARDRPGEQRLELARGGIRAFITAPPRLFLVDTPAATAVDMGCAYALHVGEDGAGMLDVTSGWVELVGKAGPSARVPAGLVCALTAGSGPGTPRRRDAGAALADAVARFDAGSPEAVGDILAAATGDDAVTLWHLLPRTARAARERVAARLAELVPPEGLDLDAALDLDPPALEAWWDRVQRGG